MSDSTFTVEDPGQVFRDERQMRKQELKRIIQECRDESFWYRALPLSVGSVVTTAALLYRGVLMSSKRFGPFPKLAAAGVVGFAVGKASYISTCKEKLEKLGFECFGPLGMAHKQRHCHHMCEKCNKECAAPAVRTEN